MDSSKATVYVVDDDKAVRKGLSLLIRSVGMNVHVCAGVQEFFRLYDPDVTSCIVLDVRMPGMSGLELQEKLVSQKIHIPVIFISGHGDVPMAMRAVKMGAVDFIEKPFREQALLESIQNAIAMDTNRRRKTRDVSETKKRIKSLTAREREVMNGIIEGKPNKTIAYDLDLNKKTVEYHRSNVIKKMGADSVAGLVLLISKADE